MGAVDHHLPSAIRPRLQAHDEPDVLTLWVYIHLSPALTLRFSTPRPH
jgi:hypothetical protein